MMKQRAVESIHYDVYIFLLIVSLAFGNLGGSLQVIRLLALVLGPISFYKLYDCIDYMKNFFIIFIAFYLFSLISLLWTPDIQEAMIELIYYPIHFLIVTEILVFSRFARNPLKSISQGWLLCVAATLLVAIWEIVTGNHLSISYFDSDDIDVKTGMGSFLRPFAAVTFGNFNGYVTFLCFAFPFLFYFLLENRKHGMSFFVSLFSIIIAIAVSLINASRGGMASIIIMIIVLLVMSKWNVYRFFLFSIVAIILVVIIFQQKDSSLLAITLKIEDGVSSDEGRIEIWSNAILVIIDYCFIGTGIGGVKSALNQLHTHTPITHNMLLEIAVQYGALFFFIFVTYLFNLYIKARSHSERNVKVILYMALFAFPMYSIINSSYLLTPFVLVSFACFSVFAYINEIKQSYKLLSKNNDITT